MARGEKNTTAQAKTAPAATATPSMPPVTYQFYPQDLIQHRMRYKGGELLFQRLGHLNARRQDRGRYADRAPERKGIWAFPFPYFDPFFAYHKFDEVVPKELRREEMELLSTRYWGLVDEAKERSEAARAELQRMRALPAAERRLISAEQWAAADPANSPAIGELSAAREALGIRIEELNLRREEWIREHGVGQMPLRRFWYSGDLYSRLNLHGQWIDGWTLISTAKFYELASQHERRLSSHDQLEVFIPRRGLGKLH